jgi:UDPglucose 6-dehydrogenase
MENKMSKLKIGIVGHGFVGKAVDVGFEHPIVEKFYADPIYNTSIDDLIEWQPNLTFVCVPTPCGKDGVVDATAAEDSVLKVLKHTRGSVVLKSTVTPDVIDRLFTTLVFERLESRFVYNPEFLTEKSAAEQYISSQFHILGGTKEATAAFERVLDEFSNLNPAPVIHVSAVEASFIKYGINSFLATKVTFFNQLYDAVEQFGGSWNKISNAICSDWRIGPSHSKVPGFDKKRGYGGACFPKDVQAFTKFSNKLTLLEECTTINNKYRSQYDLDEREKSQNVNYGQTKEEQQDQDNGSSS